MKGIEKITARIQQDAQSDISAMLQEAEAKAAALRQQYEAQADAEDRRAEESAQSAARQHLERLESAAQMEAKKMVLAAKQACLEQAFAEAQRQLLSLPEAAYVETLAKIAARAAQTGREEVIMNRRDHDAVGVKVVERANALIAEAAAPALPPEIKGSKAGELLSKVVTGASALLQGTAMLRLSAEVWDMEGGLVLRDGNVEVNCAFETQLRVLRESMAAEVAKVLFP